MKKYNEKYDAEYDDEKNVWLEKVCDDKSCIYCKGRPKKPLSDRK